MRSPVDPAAAPASRHVICLHTPSALESTYTAPITAHRRHICLDRRECSTARALIVAGPDSSARRREAQAPPTRRQLMAFLWKHSAAVVLSAPLALALPGPATAAGGPPPPTLSNGGGGGDWSGGPAFEFVPNEAAVLAAASKPITITLSSFAVTRRAYGKIVRRFTREYEEATGRQVRFQLTFGGSGTQARAVIDGLPADIVSLALPLDVKKIEEAGLIAPGWEDKFPHRSSVTESVVSIVTRKGNPKGINGWEDLARDDVEVVVANPKTAGVARWIFLALWGAASRRGTAAAIKFVTKVFDNVEIMPRDAREASDVFYTQGFGDALLTYENEAIFTNMVVSPDDPLPYISPDNNVRISCPLAIVDKNVDARPPEVREVAEAFCRYLFTPPAQAEFVACGFRSRDKAVMAAADGIDLPEVKKVWEVERSLGDWLSVQKKFFDEGGILTDIMNDVSKRKLAQRIEAARRR